MERVLSVLVLLGIGCLFLFTHPGAKGWWAMAAIGVVLIVMAIDVARSKD